MSTVKSFRFNDYELGLLDSCQVSGTTSMQTIIKALEYYYDNEIMKNKGFDLIVDFHENFDGVNNPEVGKFLAAVDQAGYEIGMYCDGDCVGLMKKE